jgi:hypothetical protein
VSDETDAPVYLKPITERVMSGYVVLRNDAATSMSTSEIGQPQSIKATRM